ncbi:MAG: nucleotidyltransferase family protein [Thermoanaerobaculia bacterium]
MNRFCSDHHIRKLALFGSVLRDDFGPESDVDVLVEFEEGHVPGFAFIEMKDELSNLMGGRRIDLITPKFLLPLMRERVLAAAEVLYAT